MLWPRRNPSGLIFRTKRVQASSPFQRKSICFQIARKNNSVSRVYQLTRNITYRCFWQSSLYCNYCSYHTFYLLSSLSGAVGLSYIVFSVVYNGQTLRGCSTRESLKKLFPYGVHIPCIQLPWQWIDCARVIPLHVFSLSFIQTVEYDIHSYHSSFRQSDLPA
jgi:hypothetical protein